VKNVDNRSIFDAVRTHTRCLTFYYSPKSRYDVAMLILRLIIFLLKRFCLLNFLMSKFNMFVPR